MTAAERELLKDLVSRSVRMRADASLGRRHIFGRCRYCGAECTGRACRGHADLPALEGRR